MLSLLFSLQHPIITSSSAHAITKHLWGNVVMLRLLSDAVSALLCITKLYHFLFGISSLTIQKIRSIEMQTVFACVARSEAQTNIKHGTKRSRKPKSAILLARFTLMKFAKQILRTYFMFRPLGLVLQKFIGLSARRSIRTGAGICICFLTEIPPGVSHC